MGAVFMLGTLVLHAARPCESSLVVFPCGFGLDRT